MVRPRGATAAAPLFALLAAACFAVPAMADTGLSGTGPLATGAGTQSNASCMGSVYLPLAQQGTRDDLQLFLVQSSEPSGSNTAGIAQQKGSTLECALEMASPPPLPPHPS